MPLHTRFATAAALCIFAACSTGASAASFPCANAFSFAQKTICNTPSLNEMDTQLGELIVQVQNQFAKNKDSRSEPSRLARRMIAERSFCVTRDCIYDWLNTSLELWWNFLEQTKQGYGREFLAKALKDEHFVIDITSERNDQTKEAFIQICTSTKYISGTGCFLAALEDGVKDMSFLDASCQRQKGASSGLSCSLLATELSLGGPGYQASTEKAANAHRKGCTLESPSACLALGDWYLMDGDEDKAAAAYAKAADLGASVNRLGRLKSDKAMLLAHVQSEPTPAEEEFYLRCIAPYENTDISIQCAKRLGEGAERRLLEVLSSLGLPEPTRKKIAQAAKKRYSTVKNIVGLGRVLGSRATVVRGEITAGQSIDRLTYILANVANQSEHLLDKEVNSLCEELGNECQNIATLKAYVNGRIKFAKERFERQYPSKNAKMTITNSAEWLSRANTELADLVAYEIRDRDISGTVQALILLDAIPILESAWQSIRSVIKPAENP